MTVHDHLRSPAADDGVDSVDGVVVRNPILPGSHPDPSIVYADGAYYVATSTFEWFPGVRIHRSDDLVTWTPLGGVLDDVRLLDLTGCPDSGGVWAPNLTCVDGVFHLVFSVVSTYTGGFTDAPNYLVTAPSITGPWSDPVALHSRGFDASLFHDGPDSWLVNLVHDWRPGHGGSAGLEATRFDRRTGTLVGEPALLELPPASGWIEGPNLYRRGEWFYLVTADGGTGYDHQVTVSRAPCLLGPYQRCPDGPLITAKDDPGWPLQKAGHGSLVRSPEDEWHLAYLVARPHGEHGPCILGRETALARIGWADGWPTVPDRRPAVAVVVSGAARDAAGCGHRIDAARESAADARAVHDVDGFDGPTLGPQWSTLRRPATADWLTLPTGTSRLRIRGGRSPQSLVEPSLVARRVTAPRCAFEATVDYQPRGFQHLAGITAYYNSQNWFFLHVTADDDGASVVRLVSSDRGLLTLHPDIVDLSPGRGAVRLGLDLDGAALSFRYADGQTWLPVGPVLDATVLSDEHAVARDETGIVRAMGFTGAFVGLWAWDLAGGGHPVEVEEATYAQP